LETMAKTLGLVCLLGVFVGCAETQAQTGAAHATNAAALDETDAFEKKPVVRLRMEQGQEPVQQAAFLAVRRTLAQQGFVVGSGFIEGCDAELLIRSERAGEGSRVALVGRLGARTMVPLTADVTGDAEGQGDDDVLSDLAMRWQRRFHRSPRLAAHLEPDLALPGHDAANEPFDCTRPREPRWIAVEAHAPRRARAEDSVSRTRPWR
jgi:hypothetical protein